MQGMVEIEVSGKPVLVSRDESALKILKNNLSSLMLNPASSLTILLNSLHEVPGDGSVWDQTERGLIAYVIDRLELFKGREQVMTSLWVRDFAMGMLTFTRELKCDLLLYGNDRDSSSDAMMPAIGDAMDITSVSKLLNFCQ
jgi:hypothetical protein